MCCGEHSNGMWKVSCGILSVPHNIVMDLNNVMRGMDYCIAFRNIDNYNQGNGTGKGKGTVCGRPTEGLRSSSSQVILSDF